MNTPDKSHSFREPAVPRSRSHTFFRRSGQRGISHLLLLCAVISVTPLRAADMVVADSMVGHWEGSAQIVVSWCKQPRLGVDITIHPNGRVTGKVGDAVLTRGRLTRNRGSIGRTLNLATDYIIRGELTGSVIAAEGIARKSVLIPVNFTNGSFAGGIHTSGLKLAGKENGILSASALKLIPEQ